jgi:hypothetical protein
MKNINGPEPPNAIASPLNLFTASGEVLPVEMDVLISSRMLVQANSGGGKSHTLRYILEETFGSVQQIVLDPEGEFATLREKFDYLLAGKDGDVPATTNTARVLCRRVMELGVSAVVDLYDLNIHERRAFVHLFLDELMNLPRELWRPLLVIIDEAHVFAPQAGGADSLAAVQALCTQGRKRGYAPILATQRIAKLDKDCVAELLNKLIGRTGLDIDVKRAGDELGFDNKQRSTLKHLAPGRFYAFGPALSREVVMVRSGDVATSHPEPGKIAPPPPPAPETIRALVEQLQDIEQEVAREEEAFLAAQDELAQAQAVMEEMQAEIEVLQKQLLEAPQSDGGAQSEGGDFSDSPEREKMVRQLHECGATIAVLRARDRDAEYIIARQQEAMLGLRAQLERLCADFTAETQKYEAAYRERRDMPVPTATETPLSLCNDTKKLSGEPEPSAIESHFNPVEFDGINDGIKPQQKLKTPARHIPGSTPGAKNTPGEKIPMPFQRILDALATYEGFGQSEVERTPIAVLAGYSVGGHFNNTLGEMHRQAFISYPAGGMLALTDKGRDHARSREFHSVADVHDAWFSLLNGPQARLLRALVEHYPTAVSRDELSRICEMRGGHFNNTLGSLKKLGAVEYPTRSAARATKLLFPDGLK